MNENQWEFPSNACKQTVQSLKVFNLVLKNKHYVEFSNKMKAVTLGHEFKENNVIKHPYFGTKKCVEDLKKIVGYETNGHVVVHQVSRNVHSGLIEKMF